MNGATTSSVNINLSNIKNLRDLSTAIPNAYSSKILRTGCVSKASDDDVCAIAKILNWNWNSKMRLLPL